MHTPLRLVQANSHLTWSLGRHLLNPIFVAEHHSKIETKYFNSETFYIKDLQFDS